MIKLKLPSPIQMIDAINNVSLYVKREDLIHPDFGGNKWRKLKYNLEEYKAQKHETLITFGGAFSNHIAASASICKYFNIPSVGIIRGTYVDNNNPTLNLAKKNGMILHHVPKLEYKEKEQSQLIKNIIKDYKNPLIVPEGGSNRNAKIGVKQMVEEVNVQGHFDHLIVAAGTGMTATGIIEGSASHSKTWVVNVLRNTSLETKIQNQLESNNKNWKILSDFDFGGYAKVPSELKEFANEFYGKYQLLLDPIYTAKMMFATMEMVKNKKFKSGDKVLTVHTGGLQGIKGFEYVTKSKWIE